MQQAWIGTVFNEKVCSRVFGTCCIILVLTIAGFIGIPNLSWSRTLLFELFIDKLEFKWTSLVCILYLAFIFLNLTINIEAGVLLSHHVLFYFFLLSLYILKFVVKRISNITSKGRLRWCTIIQYWSLLMLIELLWWRRNESRRC